jgi:photosystem II stability/assembly factor-like uncharacterized protein
MHAPRRPARFGSCLALAAVALTGRFAATGFAGENVWTRGGPIGGDQVNSLAVDPFDPRTVYAATFAGVFKSSDGGTTWQRLSGPGLPEFVKALAFHPTTPTTLYAAGCGAPGNLVKTVDGGSSWTPASSGLNSCLVALAIDPSNPSTIYVVGEGGAGVFRSTDGGASWRSIRSGMDIQTVLAVAIDPVNTSTIYAGAVLQGVFKSTDRGDRWNAASSGLPTTPNPFVPDVLHPPTIQVLTVDPVTPSTVYAGAASLLAGLFRTTNGAASWTTISPISGYVSAIVLDPSEPSTVYAGFSFSGAWRSDDGGARWIGFNNGLSDPRVTALGIDRSGTHIYAGTFGGEVFAYRFASPRLHITLPSRRVPPRVVSPRP